MFNWFDHRFRKIDGVYTVTYVSRFKLWVYMLSLPLFLVIFTGFNILDWFRVLIMDGVNGVKDDYDYSDVWLCYKTPFHFVFARKVRIDKSVKAD